MPSRNVAEFLSGYIGPKDYYLGDAEQATENLRETWVWNDFAATTTACESSSMHYQGITVSVRLDWVGDDDYSETLRELIEPLAAEQLRRSGERICDPA